jgi:ankyrin repeat protein
VSILVLIFLPLTAKAQGAVSYRFLEVVDTGGKPVPSAKVETFAFRDGQHQSTQETDENGAIKKLPVFYGDVNTYFISVSKSGYVTYEAERTLSNHRVFELEIRGYDPYGPFKIELLRMPTTESERKAVEAQRQRWELVSAVRRPDTAKVTMLLKTGVDANETAEYGIPVILWAASDGSVDIVNALLDAGADVRSKDKSGRRVLLHYLAGYAAAATLQLELVQRLIEAGADVNAVGKNGVKVLAAAKRLGDANLVKLLESAGAQP